MPVASSSARCSAVWMSGLEQCKLLRGVGECQAFVRCTALASSSARCSARFVCSSRLSSSSSRRCSAWARDMYMHMRIRMLMPHTCMWLLAETLVVLLGKAEG